MIQDYYFFFSKYIKEEDMKNSLRLCTYISCFSFLDNKSSSHRLSGN